MGGLGQFGGVVAEEVQDAGGAVWLVVREHSQGLPQGQFAEIRLAGITAAIQPIKEGSNVQQSGAVFKEVLLDHLLPCERTSGGNRFHRLEPSGELAVRHSLFASDTQMVIFRLRLVTFHHSVTRPSSIMATLS